jgi:hypothetical protein
MIFVSILFGVFTGSLEAMLWKLFDWLIDILKPILAIILLVVGAIKLPPLIFAIVESLYTDYRQEKYEWDLVERLERTPLPTPQNSGTKTATEPTSEAKTEPTTQSRGEYMMLAIDEGNEVKFEYAYKNTSDYANLKSKGARDVGIVKRQDVIKSKAQAQRQVEIDEINELSNERLKHVQSQITKPKEFKSDPQEMEGYNNLIGSIK